METICAHEPETLLQQLFSASFFVTYENVCFSQAGDKEENHILIHHTDIQRGIKKTQGGGWGQVFATRDCIHWKSRNFGSETEIPQISAGTNQINEMVHLS